MEVYICDDHAGHYPVGTCSVVVAADEAQARDLLSAELSRHGLPNKLFTLRRLNINEPRAFVVHDGDY